MKSPLSLSQYRVLTVLKLAARQRFSEFFSGPPITPLYGALNSGDPEWRAEEIRRRDGIPLADGVWEKLTEAAERPDVVLPNRGA